MKIDPVLVDSIYEAAVVQDRWPHLLERIATEAGSVGAVFMTRSPTSLSWVSAPSVADAVEAFMAEGWTSDPYSEPLLRDRYPGFRCPTHYSSVAEIENSRIHREFFRPRGMIGAAGTVIQGSGDDLMHLAFDGFPSFEAAHAALPYLDALRPHLARALSLTSLAMAARAQATVDSLALAGIAAAVVSGGGRLKAANPAFEARLYDAFDTSRHRLRFTDRFLDQQFAQSLTQAAGADGLFSIATRVQPGQPPLVVHMLPLRGAAKAVCDSDGVLLIVADGTNASLPGADLLRTLFDLTPAEARLVRLLAEGLTLAEAAARLGITINTVRVQLRAAFAKTGVNRQAELQALLSRLGPGR